MEEMPPLAELKHFKGDAIAQIRLDPFAVQLAFESGWQIDVNERLQHITPDGTVWAYNCKASLGEPTVLQLLLYKRIVDVERDDLTITLKIEDGSSLSIFSVRGPYESGVLWAPDRRDWTVF